MSSSSDLFAQAWQCYQARQFAQAEQLYHQILQSEPGHADAWCFLGAVQQAVGRMDDAVASYRRAVELIPNYTSALNCLGIALAQQGNLPEAAASFERALAYQPYDVESLNNLGLVRLQQGWLDDAIACYQQALQLQPDFEAARTNLANALRQRGQNAGIAEAPGMANPEPESVRNLIQQGVVLAKQGRMDEAESYFLQAVQLQPQALDALNNLGGVYFSRQRYDDAVRCYQQVLQLDPNYITGHYNLGAALERLDRLQEAAFSYERALQLDPRHADAWNNLGNVRRTRGDFDGALACYQEVLRLRPDLYEVYINLSIVQADREDYAAAEASLRQAERYLPHNAEVHNGLGIVLARQGRAEEATKSFQRALALDPQFADVYNNMGIALKDQGKFAEAIANYQHALNLTPGSAQAHTNWANALQEQGRHEEARQHYDEALRLTQDAPDAHFNRAILRLLQGDWEGGWPEYEWRWQTKSFPHYGFAQPRWDGSDLGGKTIFIYAEQGLGDTLNFVRYVPLVKQRGGKVILQCQPPLKHLLSSCPGVDLLIPQGDPVPPFHVHAALLSLPAIFQTTLGNLPGEVPYLFADAELVKQWQNRLKGKEFKIGIVWQGNPRFGYDKHRSIALTEFASLAQLPGVKLISLQKGKGREQIDSLGGQFSVMELDQLDEASGPFMDTAAVIKNLDLVITPDTAIGHLAGALAARVWIALQVVPNWRWMLGRSDSPWYPTARLFRQKEIGNWKSVFAEMTAALSELLSHRA